MITTEPMVLSLSLFLSVLLRDCGWLSPMLRCSVSGCGVWQKSVIFQNVGRCPQLALVCFCHFKAPMDSPLLFQTTVSLGMLCFILGHWIGSLLKLHKKKNRFIESRKQWLRQWSWKSSYTITLLAHLPHTSHEGFQKEVQVNLFFFIFCIFFIIVYYSIVTIFIWIFWGCRMNHLSFHYFLWGNSLW